MVNFSLGNQGSRYNPNEPRDWHGRWTRGGSSWENNPLRNPGAVGRAHTLLGHARAGAWQKGVLRDFALPTPAEAKRFSRLLAVWNAASDLDDDSFREHFARGLDIGPATLRRLRQAAAGSAQAQTIGQMIEASYPLTAAIKDIGGHRWPAMLEGLEDEADAAMPVHRTRRAALDHEDQPIDSERGTPSSLLRLAASVMNLPAAPEGRFELASDFNSKPVPFLDDRGRPVIGASGKPAMIPELVKPNYFVDKGLETDSLLNNQEMVPTDDQNARMLGLAKLALDLYNFRQNGPWDLQRNPSNTPDLVDGATIAIGLYAAAAGMSEDELLKMQNDYAREHSHFPANTPMDDTYPSLPKRNVENTHIGYELYRSGRIGPGKKG